MDLEKTYKNEKSSDPSLIKGAPGDLHSRDFQSWQKVKQNASKKNSAKKNYSLKQVFGILKRRLV